MDIKLAAHAASDHDRAGTLRALAELPGTALLTPREAAAYLATTAECTSDLACQWTRPPI